MVNAFIENFGDVIDPAKLKEYLLIALLSMEKLLKYSRDNEELLKMFLLSIYSSRPFIHVIYSNVGGGGVYSPILGLPIILRRGLMGGTSRMYKGCTERISHLLYYTDSVHYYEDPNRDGDDEYITALKMFLEGKFDDILVKVNRQQVISIMEITESFLKISQ